MSQSGAPAVIQDTFHRKNYKTDCVLGKGGFATVYQVTDLYSHEVFACKLTPKAKLSKKKFFEKFTSEIKIHRQLEHQYIVSVNNVFKDTINYYMLMELCDSGTLSDIVRKRQKGITEEEVQRIAWELCSAYSYLKQHSVVHRDMKSSNVFLASTRCLDIDPSGAKRAITCKIGDFGLSVQLEQNDEKHFTLCGTPNFLSPETIVSHVFKRMKINRECDQNIDADCQELCKQLVARLTTASAGRSNYDHVEAGHSYPSDMWSLGCILYSLLFQRPPFEANNIQNTYKKIVKGDYQLNQKMAPNVSESCYNFIERLLKLDPNDRMTIEQAMQHEWLADGRNVKLKYLPVDVLDPSFNPEMLEKDLSIFCRYQGKISDQITKFREGKIEQIAVVETDRVNTNIDKTQKETDIAIDEYLRRKYSHYDFTARVIHLSNPTEFPPVMIFAQVKNEAINHQSITEYKATLDENDAQVVFNDYDLWCKFISDNAKKANQSAELIHFHQHVNTLSWIDFSNRYGFSYQLSNGCVGVLFNDMSVIVLSPNLEYVDYIDLVDYTQYQRNATQILENKQQEVNPEKQQFMLRMRYEHAKRFMSEKKFKLIMYFKEYLEQRSIQPLTDDKKDSSDHFIGKYFDYMFDEGCFLYAKKVTDEEVLQASNDRKDGRDAIIAGRIPEQKEFPPCAVKMVECKIHEELVKVLVDTYVDNLHKKFGSDSPVSAKQSAEFLTGKIIFQLMYPQVYVKRYYINENTGSLCILYNSKVFQVNFQDHIKVVIAHKTVTIINSKREMLVYPSTYLRSTKFDFDELRARISESRRLYELVKKGKLD